MNLIPAIKAMLKQIEELDAKHELKKSELIEGLKILRKINTVCEYCEGKGKLLRKRVNAEDDRPDPNDIRDYIKCYRCSGTGKSESE